MYPRSFVGGPASDWTVYLSFIMAFMLLVLLGASTLEEYLPGYYLPEFHGIHHIPDTNF